MPTTTGRFLLLSLLVALLASVPFITGLPGNFVFDDIANIVNNEPLKLERLDLDSLREVVFSYQYSGTMRVLPTLSFALDYWRAGAMDPATFRITNLFIHTLTACVLAWFFRALLLVANVPATRVKWAAPGLALAWAVHPLQVSAVLYVVQRMQTMGTLFLVLALWAYLSARRAQMEGRAGRRGMLLAFMAWLLAMGCKEDTVLLPAYLLALELTVLKFAAASPALARGLRRGYLFAGLFGAALYAFVVVPHYWQWDAYNGRTFSTPERLLTQARVLCMYLGQILLPFPRHMPFYYDWLQPSRGLLQPWTTLAAVIALLALLGAAWRLRTRWPLFALGVLLFFAAHFITSNVVNLELAFEHRNHFALVGAVLAIGSLLWHVGQRLRLRPVAQAGLCAALLIALCGATLLRSASWHDTLTLARTSTELAPHSGRAWISLCAAYFEQGGSAEAGRGNPSLDTAIDTCTQGSAAASYAVNSPALLVVLKTIRGDVSSRDWEQLQHRVETVQMTFDNRRAPKILTYHALNGVKLDKQQLLRLLDTLVRRAPLTASEYVSIGNFVMNDMEAPDAAIIHFSKGIQSAHPADPFPYQLEAELRQKGRPDLADRIRDIAAAQRHATASGNGTSR